MVIVNLKGGLGNQLFEYASALAIAKARDQELVFDTQSFKNDSYGRQFGLNNFKIDNSCFSEQELASFNDLSIVERVKNYLNSRNEKLYYSLGDLEMDLSILKSNPKHQYLNGYFANPAYFDSIRTKLLQNITLKDTLKSQVFIDKELWVKQNQFISVHIRRADYISDKGANQLFETLGRDYYDRCISYFESIETNSKKFLFFSDDIEWVKSEFRDIDEAYFIEDPNLNKDYYDLMLMASCEHNIIANSTFSWWGAWLNQNPDKIVLAPEKWYSNKEYQAFYEKTNFTPKNWQLR